MDRRAVSDARAHMRESIASIALSLVGFEPPPSFDLVHSPICPLDVVIVAGSPWLMEGLKKDFLKGENGYRKIGGGANTPNAIYFFRAAQNLIYYMKRQKLYISRGEPRPAVRGMACFFDWEDRGRFNFTPDRAGIVTSVSEGRISKVVSARKLDSNFVVVESIIDQSGPMGQAIIGYGDLP